MLTSGVKMGYNVLEGTVMFMDSKEKLEHIETLTRQLAAFPKGYISKKTIGGNVYYYHQWSENGVKQSRYLRDDEINPLAEQINRRKGLQEQIRSLKAKSKTAQTAKQRNEVASLKCTFMP